LCNIPIFVWEENMNIQWFPGHMAKTRRMIDENIKFVDIVVEILDARLPLSSKNGDIDDLISKKPRIVILNKADLADASVNKEWEKYFEKSGAGVLIIDSLHAKNLNIVTAKIREKLKDKLEKEQQKGMTKAIKVMVVGIPNVGKSSFINKLAKRAGAKTGDKPGVTRGKQWIRLDGGLELLDTPGILPPKFEDQDAGLKLAFVGSVKDEIIDTEELSMHLLTFLSENYRECLCARYKLDDIDGLDGYELLCLIGKKRGFVVSGGEIDTERASHIVLDEFRSAKIGNISLERPGEEN